MFVNRVQELAFLERLFDRDGAQLVVLWGRRRVGKTALLRQFARGKRIFYHAGTLSTEPLELARLSAAAADFFKDPLLAAHPLTSWEAALAYFESRLGQNEQLGVILDEFPHLVAASPRLPSLLQIAWDERLKDTRLKLILCGSSIAMMESMFFSARAPLYGRRTGQWKVEPFDTVDLGLMFPARTLVELLELYCVVGGVPLYAERLEPAASLVENIRQHILTKGELLYEEVPFLLREELRDPRVYQSILAVMAAGSHKFGELSSKTGLDRAHLTGYLATLSDLGLVARDVPITDPHPEKSRSGRYVILDPYVNFWYRFVYSNLSRLETGDVDGVAALVAQQLHNFVSLNVERPVAALFRRGPLRPLVPFEPTFLGRHWSPSEEFDVVALDSQRRRALVAEVKWSDGPVPTSVAEDLQRRIIGCRALQGVEVTAAVVSRRGFRGRASGGTALVDLQGL